MTKKEFLKELETRLQILDEKERRDIIEEYSQHIGMRMESGMKEEEAIDDFGDMNDLIAEILEAYHLDPQYEVKNRERRGMPGITELLPKDFFGKRTKKVRESKRNGHQEESGNYFKTNGNHDTERNGRFKTNGYQESERDTQFKTSGYEKAESDNRFKINQGRKVEVIADKAMKTSEHAVSWSWDKIKKLFYIFIKVVLVCLALPAIFLDLAGLFGLGTLGVMAFRGYPVIGCIIVSFGAVMSMTAYILFLFTYILRGRSEKA